MDLLPHIIETRERLVRLEVTVEQALERRGLAERIGWNLLSRNLAIAIAVLWALWAGKDQIAVELLSHMQ